MKRTILAIVALTIALSPTASASLARAVSFEEKVQSAEAIVLGRCVRTNSTFDPSGHWIVTYSTFAVEKSYKGAATSEITIVTPGGIVGSLHQETIGVPRFREGDRNVIFISHNPLGPTVLFFDQGTYSVRNDNGKEVVAPVESDLVLLDTQTGRVAAGESARSLDDFSRELQTALDQPGRRNRE